MSVQTVHFFRPPSPKVYRPTFLGSKNKRLMQQHIYCATTKINQFSELAMWQMIPLAMYYDLHIIVNIVSSKFNLNMYFLWIQRKYVQFHNMKFKMPKSQLLIGLETSFKNWQKAQNVNIYFPSKAYCCYPLLP